jgi:hypothetical protein
MSMTAPIIDPLHTLVAGGFVSGTKRPILRHARAVGRRTDLPRGAAQIIETTEERVNEAELLLPLT